MATYRIKEETLTNIANSIRNVTGKTGDIAVSDMAVAIGQITPSGTLNITENGTYDVTEYASAEVVVGVGNICYIGTIEPSEGLGIDGDICIMQEA